MIRLIYHSLRIHNMTTNALTELLRNGVEQLHIKLSAEQFRQLLEYLQLLGKWNQAYNLTAISVPEEMVKLHLFDSLAIAPYLKSQRNIDIGTGAGLPGIPLAIYFPQRQFTLLDSNGKKTRFLTHVKQQLGLNNVEIIHDRAESYRTDKLYDAILSRAFASLKDMLNCTAHLCAQQGRFLALKGTYPDAEIGKLPSNFKVEKVIPLTVPEIEAERHLLIIQRK